MKTSERHHLKENELAISLRSARAVAERHRREVILTTMGVLVLIAAVVGYIVWRQRVGAQSSEKLAEALVVAQAPVVPPAPAAAPGAAPSPAPVAPPGSFPSDRARLEAALPKFMAAADAYPSSKAGIAARYHAASTLAALGRPADAARRYQEVIDRAGNGIYGRMAQLGLAETQMLSGQHERAITTYRELSMRKDTGLPVDAVLMQLGRAYVAAGKSTEARQTFTRIVDEFPESPYAAEARRELDTLKLKSAA